MYMHAVCENECSPWPNPNWLHIIILELKVHLHFINFNLAFNTYKQHTYTVHTPRRSDFQSSLYTICNMHMLFGMWPIVNHVVFRVFMSFFTNARILNTLSVNETTVQFRSQRKKLDFFRRIRRQRIFSRDSLNFAAVQISMKYLLWCISSFCWKDQSHCFVSQVMWNWTLIECELWTKNDR